jgi:hypothetical protein
MDAISHNVLPDAYVTIRSPALRQDLMAVTDAAGNYRVGSLPPGTYSVSVEKEGYLPHTRKDVAVAMDVAVTVNAELVPVGHEPPPVPPAGHAPAVDLTTGAAGGSVEADFVRSAAVLRTGERDASGRSLELLAGTLPGARTEPLGLALSGGSPLEKQVLLDGLSVTDPATGALLFPLSMELVESLDVLSGGYLPEHGRSAGGALLASLKSGSNEWRATVYGQWAPGGLEGARAQVVPRLAAWRLSEQLWNQGDAGAALSGPLLKDRLWFSLGVQWAAERWKLTRRIFQYQFVTDPGSGQSLYEVDPATGEEVAREIDGSARSWFADERQLQYAAKVTWLPGVSSTVSLALASASSPSGLVDGLGFDPYTGGVWGWQPATTQAMSRGHLQDGRALVLSGSTAFWDRQLTVEGSLGWYHQRTGFGGESGAGVGPQPRLLFRQGNLPGPHGLDDFTTVLGEDVPPQVEAACFDGLSQAPGVRRCPMPSFAGGGIGEARLDQQERVQARAAGTYLLNSLGHHVVKAGGEVEWLRLDRDSSFGGGTILREGDPVQTLDDFRAYGALDSGGNPVFQGAKLTVTSSLGGGAFIQDSWHLLDVLRVNLGVRWDAQVLTAPDGATALSLWSQFSPRAGVILDVFNNGKSKLYGSYGRSVQAVPLDLVTRNFGGEQYLLGRYRVGPGCDLSDPAALGDPMRCRSPANAIDFQQYGGTRPPVDPAAQATAVDEFLVGAEYEVLPDLLAGALLTHRTLVRSLRAITTNEGSSVFIANPGTGMGAVVDPAARDYDAVTVSVDRTFPEQWMAQLSYTWSWLRGNEDGVFEPFTSWSNRSGPLPGDHTHSVKLFGGKDFALPGKTRLNAGASYLAESGAPTSVLGSHLFYGDGTVFLLPRGSGPRLPWAHSVDLHLALQQPLPGGLALQATLDAFNVFNFQAVTAIDERFTLSDAVPLQCPCTEADLANVVSPSGAPVVPNPSFRRPTAYQLPRTIRFGAKLAF